MLNAFVLWFRSQPLETQLAIVGFALQQLCSFAVGLMPQRWGGNPLVKAMGHVANTKFRDAFGTFKLPGYSARDTVTEPSVIVEPGTSGR